MFNEKCSLLVSWTVSYSCNELGNVSLKWIIYLGFFTTVLWHILLNVIIIHLVLSILLCYFTTLLLHLNVLLYCLNFYATLS